MIQKLKKDVSSSWVDPAISTIASTFSCESSLERYFFDMGHFSDWGVLTIEEDKGICSEHGGWGIHLYEWTFSILGLCFPFNDF